MIITLNGEPGSGKSSVGRLLAKRCGYQFYSAGDVRGKYAVEHGLTINQLNKLAENDPVSDQIVDEYLAELGKKEDDFIIDARLGYFFIPQSVKVFLDAEPEVRAQRIFGEARADEKYTRLQDARRGIKARVESDKKRYAKLYGTDPYSHSHYDLIIDTTKLSQEEVVGQIYRFAMFNSNPARRG